MHIIHLPTTDFESADYECLAPTSSTPVSRYGHSAAIIEDQIYIYGGLGPSHQPLNESGKVHVFNTKDNTWSTLNPSTLTTPPNVSYAAAIATDQPRPLFEDERENDPNPKFSTARKDLLLKHDLDPAKNVPEPPKNNTYGTLIIYGGKDAQNQACNEMWAFDIASRTWSQLPSPPLVLAPIERTNLALVGNRLYTYVEGQTCHLDLDMKSLTSDKGGLGQLGVSPSGPWSVISSPAAPNAESTSTEAGASLEQKKSPGLRDGAALIPVTTGQGRNYLLLIGGESSSSQSDGSIWALQLKPEGMTAASFKDAARMAMKRNTREEEWAEVRYYDTEGKIVQENQAGRGIDERSGFMASKVGEMDGGAVVVWGGLERGSDSRQRVLGDGLIISIDI